MTGPQVTGDRLDDQQPADLLLGEVTRTGAYPLLPEMTVLQPSRAQAGYAVCKHQEYYHPAPRKRAAGETTHLITRMH